MAALIRGNLSQAEADWLQHMTMFGSAGYPVRKLRSGRWIVEESWGVKGPPTVFKTRREAVGFCSRFEDILIDKCAGRIE